MFGNLHSIADSLLKNFDAIFPFDIIVSRRIPAHTGICCWPLVVRMGEDRTPIIVGISGVSSSGKTTLARLLRDTWPGTVVLHEDDFYLPDKLIPVRNGIQDWDCFEAINVAKFYATLSYIKRHGKIPSDFISKEDQNSVGETPVDDQVIQNERDRICQLAGKLIHRPIFLIDGFLLYSFQMKPIWELLNIRLFLRTSHAKTKARREARKGYVTIEGFWEDPPGYIDNIVWPNYIQDHAFLFLDGNVEGALDAEQCNRMNINVMPDNAQDNMTKCLIWASGIIEAFRTNNSTSAR